MFGLIPMTITIILAAVVLLSMAFIGGDIFGESSEEAKALRVINEGQQIASAVKMYRFKEMKSPANVIENVIKNDEYYKGGTKTVIGDWRSAEDEIGLAGLTANVENESVCKAVNLRLGYEGVPQCSSIETDAPELVAKSQYYCCTDAP